MYKSLEYLHKCQKNEDRKYRYCCYLNEKDRANLWKAHMSNIMYEENELDHTADADTVQGTIERVMR